MNDNLQALQNVKLNGGTVTYHFADGTKTVASINKEIFVNEKGRERSPESILDIFSSTAHDLGATSFNL